MKKQSFTGIELTDILKKLANESELSLEIKVTDVSTEYAKGVMTLESIPFEYEYHGSFLYLDAYEVNEHFDHIKQWDEQEFNCIEKEWKTKVESYFPVPLVINLY